MYAVDRDQIRSTAALYDALADEYARRVGTEISAEFETTFDYDILAAAVVAFRRRPGVVLDLGCGTGRVTSYLSKHGVDVVGLDVSPRMLALASAAHPNIPFSCGLLTDIPARSACVVGVVCWYSIIHTSPDDLDGVFAEISRTCQDDAEVVLAFQAGDGERVDRGDAYATGRTMTSFRHSVDHVTNALTGAGLRVTASREREAELHHETTPQGFVMARSPGHAPAP
jgi:SAM-dependent methyltransferase